MSVQTLAENQLQRGMPFVVSYSTLINIRLMIQTSMVLCGMSIVYRIDTACTVPVVSCSSDPGSHARTNVKNVKKKVRGPTPAPPICNEAQTPKAVRLYAGSGRAFDYVLGTRVPSVDAPSMR